ncbi:MAG: RNA polymerase sigma factor [Acidimicrobiales bacterium]
MELFSLGATIRFLMEDRGPDEEDMRASRAEPDRFASIFERRVRDVHRYVSYRAGPGSADELTSETFAQAFASRASYDPAKASVKTWLYGVATNVVNRHLRLEQRRQEAATRARAQRQLDFGPDDSALDIDRLQLKRALGDMSPRLHDVVILVAALELTYEEAAHVLSIPVGTVRSRYSRGRKQLSRSLASTRESRSEGELA